MLEWIVALILFFCGVVLISLYYFEIRENRELRLKLKVANEAIDPNSSKRLESPERFIEPNGQKTNHDSVFAATFEDVEMDSIEESLKTMIAKAEREILIVSSGITETAWRRIKWDVVKFVKNGGELSVFLKGDAYDFAGGRSDRSVVDEVIALGGILRCSIKPLYFPLLPSIFPLPNIKTKKEKSHCFVKLLFQNIFTNFLPMLSVSPVCPLAPASSTYPLPSAYQSTSVSLPQ